MKTGILSDTHNHMHETRKGLDLLVRHGATHLVHCGDAGEDVLDLISATCQEKGIRAHVALGNCDGHAGAHPGFTPSPAGIELGEYLEFQLEGKRCAVLHGHQYRRLRHLVESGHFDYVFTGHTHQVQDERVGPTRLLNPGSCARARNGTPSVLLLEPTPDIAVWLPL